MNFKIILVNANCKNVFTKQKESFWKVIWLRLQNTQKNCLINYLLNLKWRKSYDIKVAEKREKKRSL